MNQPATIDAIARDITPAPVAPKLPRLTPQQAAFVVAMLRFGVPSKAYHLAYKVSDDRTQKWVYVEASRLMANPKVSAHLQWYRQQAAHDNLNTVLREFDQNRNGALEASNFSAANGATRGKAQVLGLIPHNAEQGLAAGVTINIHLVAQDEGLF